MKKMLVLFAVLAIAGSAFAVDTDVEVTITIAEYLNVTTGGNLTLTPAAAYDVDGYQYIGGVAQFFISSNAPWNASVDADGWATSGLVPSGDAYHLFPNHIAVNKTVHMSEGRTFSTTVTLTVTN
jgi:hypothetical protein